MEDLHVAGMVRNRKLARALSDVGMAELRRQLDYKTTWNGRELVVADRFYPSSKTCNAVSAHWPDLLRSGQSAADSSD